MLKKTRRTVEADQGIYEQEISKKIKKSKLHYLTQVKYLKTTAKE